MSAIKWKKVCKVFDPTRHKLIDGCFEFAQSPQALVFDNFIRIYFSTRQKDGTGKYLSQISFVDFTKDFKDILKVSSEKVIELGALGCFDEHGIFPMNILRNNDQVWAYTCGWSRRVSVSIETAIGFAISEDQGLTFRKYGRGPILASSLNEPILVGDPFVKIINNYFHMWYIYGIKWLNLPAEVLPARIYKIGHAISRDGISWQKDGRQLISDKLNPDECQALPTVTYFDNRYHMYFCYREATDFRTNKHRGYRIGYAFSDDLNRWTRDDDQAGIDVSENGWDSDMLCYPHVFQSDGKIYLLYNGNEFGRFGFGLAEQEM